MTSFLAFLSALSTALVFLGGVAFALAHLQLALVLTGIGAGWLGVLYSALLRRL